ncbi:MAG: hypothetical protein DRP79_03715, partial [Planctomycetota bacterium]
IEDLKKMAEALDNKQHVYLEIAQRYDDLTQMAKEEIEGIDARLRALRRGPGGHMQQERIFRAESELKTKTELRDEYLRLAAAYYERGFDEDPYSGARFRPREHALWKAAHRLLERSDYAGAERILLRIARPELRFDRELVLKSQVILGRMYRDLGRNEEALKTFRFVMENSMDEGAQLRGEAAYEEAVTLAAIGSDAAAESAFRALMRDDNPYGVGVYSKIWRQSAFALGRVYYRMGIAADDDREKKLNLAVETLTDALDRYKSFVDEETRNQSLFYVGDSLVHLALLAVERDENDKARALFSRARAYLARMDAPERKVETMPVYYRNSRLIFAEALVAESRIVPDAAEKQKLLKRASGEYALMSKLMEGTEQGLWALIQLGCIARESGDEFAARRCFDLAAAAIAKLEKKSAFANNPGGFDAGYLQKVLDWLRNRNLAD